MRSNANAPSAGSAGILVAAALLLALGFLTAATSPAHAAVGHSVLRTISTGANSAPRAIASDSAGNIYVGESNGGRIEKFDSAGNAVAFSGSARYIEGNRIVGYTEANFPDFPPYLQMGIAVDNSGGPNDGNIYFTPQVENSTTYVYAPTGIYLGQLGPGGGFRCSGAVNPSDGSVLIGQDYTGFPLHFPEPDSAQLATASADSELRAVSCALAVDASGDIYSGWSGGIRKYDSSQLGVESPTPSLVFDANAFAQAVALDPVNGDLYASTGSQLVKWNSAGAQQGSPFGQLLDSRGVTVDSAHRVSAIEAEGGVYVYGADEVQLPTGATGGSSSVTATTADVAGSADLDGAGTITGCEFRYGEDTGYSDGSVPCTPGAPIASPTAVSAHLTGLVSATRYHYRLFLTNANGTTMAGTDQNFLTPPATQDVSTLPATEVERDSAVLNGSYTGDGQDVHYFFEWGRTNGYGHTTPVPPGGDAGTGTGTQNVAPIQISGLEASRVYHYRLVVSTASGITPGPDQTFTTATAVVNLTADKPLVVTESTADLRASFDGDGSLETDYFFEWGPTAGYGNKTPVNSVPAGTGRIEVPPVTISGLQGHGAAYHFRVVASNDAGTAVSADQSFRTADAPVVSNLQSRNVAATSATLAGNINPRYGHTTWQFEWGTTPDYGNVAPATPGDAGSGDEPVEVTAQLENLSPGSTYHFRLVATSDYGTTASPDQSFGFYPPKCPNSQVRQETRSNSLPDCRGFELVSPSFAQGTAIMPNSGPTSPVATNPPRLAYAGTWGLFPEETGEPTASFSDLYVSTRTNARWIQRYVGLGADEAMLSAGPMGASEFSPQFADYGSFQRGTQATPDLGTVLSYDWGYPGQLESFGFGQNAPYVWDTTSGDLLDRWPTNLEEVPGGEDFIGFPHASADLSHLVFTSNVVFAPGGQPSVKTMTCCGTPVPSQQWPEDYVYDNDTETGEVVLASRKSAAQGEDPFTGRAFHVSEDGSRILLADEAELNMGKVNPFALMEPEQEAKFADVTGPLYLRIDAERTLEIAPAGAKFRYAGSSPDGKTVYITSAAQLTTDDHDTSRDLFVWHESDPDTLTRLSFGDHGNAGDTDVCVPNEAWTANCGIRLPDANYGFTTDSSIGNGISDSYFASEDDAIYFESPEQLVGQLGEIGARNLYLYRDGTVRFVATLSANGPIPRMQVTPDGEHMAFITKSRLTDYDNAGHSVMYTYEPGGGPVNCVSCRPDGLPPQTDTLGSSNGLYQSADGRTFFNTGDPLVPRDTNEVEDIYEYTEGKPQLITTGIGPTTGKAILKNVSLPGLIGVTLSGTDVYFATIDNLVTQDHNGAQLKIYDARVGGGFPAEREEPKCVAADECHGPSTNASPLPADRTSAPIGSTTPKAKPKKRKTAKKHRKARKHKKARKHAKKRGERNG